MTAKHANKTAKESTRLVKDLIEVLDLATRPGFEEWLRQEKWRVASTAGDSDTPFHKLVDKSTADGAAASKSSKRKPKPSVRPMKVFIGGGGEPGGYLRWLAVLELIATRWEKEENAQWKGITEAGNADGLALFDVSKRLYGDPSATAVESAEQRRARATWSDKVNNAFSSTPVTNSRPAEDYSKKDDLYNTIDEALCDIFERDGRSDHNLQTVMGLKTRFKGDTFAVAVERLRNFVSGIGCPAADHLSRLHAETFIHEGSAKRKAFLAKVVDQLMTDGAKELPYDAEPVPGDEDNALPGPPELTGLKPLTNVYIDDAWTGLRAFATEVCLAVKFESTALPRHLRPVLIYLPLDRYEAETLAIAGSDAPEAIQRQHIDSVIDELYRAAFPEEPAPQVHEHGEHLKRLLRLQEELPKRRLIVILGGIELPADPFGAIWNVLRNSDWPTVLKQLVQARFSRNSSTEVTYRTRFLVLSNRLISDLKPWRSFQGELPPPHPGEEARALLSNPDKSALEARLSKYWNSAQHGPTVANQSLYAVYNPDKAAIDALTVNGLPNESELSIFRASQDCGNGHNLRSKDWQVNSIEAWVKRPLRGEKPVDPMEDFRGILAQWLAVSVSGLRQDTLVRLAERFLSETPAERLAAMDVSDLQMFHTKLGDATWIEEFGERYRYVIALTTDRDRLDVAGAFAQFELHGRLDEDVVGARPNLHLDIRNERVREFILAEMLRSPAGQERFRRMNELLARESLSQATTRMRHAATGGQLDDIMVRRMVQTIFHGLLSLNAEELTELDPRPEAQPLSHDWRTLPENGYRRLVYLYEFLYRKILEAPPSWRLGRTLAKEDLRLSLLAMFANPGWSKRVLSILAFTPPKERGFEVFGAFAFNTVAGFGRALQPSALHLRGELGVDLFISLLRACLSSTKHPLFAQRAEVIGGQLAIHRSLRPGTGNEFRRMRTFKKLQIDALQATNTLDDSSPILDIEMKVMRVDFSWLSEDWINALIKDGWLSQIELSAAVKVRIEEICKRDHRELGHISDLAFRHGEHIATKADWADDRGRPKSSLPRYARAYAVFFIADRIRSAAATLDDSTVEWPSISARAMRYFIRVALKTSKLTARLSADRDAINPAEMREAAMQFYQHAMSRIDVYSRHLAGYPTEEVHGLILMASAARVRSSIAKSFSTGDEREARQVGPLLTLSLDYLDEAWPKLCALGMPRALARRFTLERFKTYAKLATHYGEDKAPAHVSEMVKRDRKVLDGLAGKSPYWRALLGKLAPVTSTTRGTSAPPEPASTEGQTQVTEREPLPL